MRALRTGTRAWLLGSAILFSYSFLVDTAQANSSDATMIKPSASLHRTAAASDGQTARPRSSSTHRTDWVQATRSYGISCVPFARQISGIKVVGNAWQWWNNAEGLYARGDHPEAGSVLNFRPNGRMHLGHVAVVTQVVNAREVIVDQANWPSGGGMGGRVSRNVAVVDVSEANNWSAVRVELRRGAGEFGSVYPTYGFIYNRPDTGFVAASVNRPAPQAAINSVPSDLRPVAERPWRIMEEVAEAPTGSPKRIDLSTPPTTPRIRR